MEVPLISLRTQHNVVILVVLQLTVVAVGF